VQTLPQPKIATRDQGSQPLMRLDASTFLLSSGKRVLEPRGGLSSIFKEPRDLEETRRQQREEILSIIRQEEILEK